MEKEMLKGKVAIITGASYGMGQTMGAAVCGRGRCCGTHRQRKRKTGSRGGRDLCQGRPGSGVVADVCSTVDTKRVFETALREFGDVDILINNAASASRR